MTFKNNFQPLAIFSLILVKNIFAQTASQARAPIIKNAPDCGACYCTTTLGQAGPISIQNNDNDLISKFDPLQHFQYKQVHLWSKADVNEGVKIQMTNPGYQGGTGIQKDTQTTFKSVTGLQLTQVQWRFSVSTPYQIGCHLSLTMDDGVVFEDASSSIGNQGCNNYAEETAVFSSTQFVFSFFSFSDTTLTKKSPSYLGINYYQCLCRNIQISIPNLQNMKATVLGQSQSQTVVLDYGLFTCTPISVTISPAVSWMTYIFADPNLTITIGSINVVDISTQTFTVMAQYSSLTPTTTSFNASIEACQLSSSSIVSSVSSFSYIITPAAQMMVKTPTFSTSPSCPGITSSLVISTNITAPYILVSGSQIQISTSQNTLHGLYIQVTYVFTANNQVALAVTGTFVVFMFSPCSTAVISGTQMAAMSYTVLDPSVTQTGSYSDSYSTSQGQINYCGALTSSITSLNYVWMSLTGQTSLSVQTNDIYQVGSYTASYSVSLVQYPTVSTTFTVVVVIDSTCPNTIINQQTLTSMIIQVGSQTTQVFAPFTDVLSAYHSDGVSYCQPRMYSISPIKTFISLSGTQISLSSASSADKGQYAMNLNVALASFPTVAAISSPFSVTILDCVNGIISSATQFTSTAVSIFGGSVQQSTALVDDNFQLCGPYVVSLVNPQPWVTFTYIQDLLTVIVDVTDLTTPPATYVLQWIATFSSFANPPQTINWTVNVIECQVSTLTAVSVLSLFQSVPLFQDYTLQLPAYQQSPASCSFQVQYVESTGLLDPQSGLISMHLTDRSLVGAQFQVSFFARTMAITSIQSEVQTITFQVTNGCEFAVIIVINVTDVSLNQGATSEQIISVGDSVSESYLGFCGEYSIKLVDSTQTFVQISGNQIKVQGGQPGIYSVGLNVGLLQYPLVPEKLVSFQVKINHVFSVPVYPTMANLTEDFSLEVGLQSWQYWLPKPQFTSVQNSEESQYQVNVSISLPHISLIREVRINDQIGLALVAPITEESVGIFSVKIDLNAVDAYAVQHNKRYQLNFAIVNPENSILNTETKWAPNVKNTTEGKNSAKIKVLDSTGLLVLEFSEPVAFNSTFKTYFDEQLSLGKPIIDLQVIPGNLSDHKNLELFWNLTSFETSSLTFQLSFANPVYVSSETNYPEKLLVVFKQPDLFSSTFNHPLETRQLTRPLQTQWKASMSKSAFVITQSLQSLMAAALTQNLILNLVLGGSLDQLWSLVEGLQLVLHSMLFNISFPQNALTFVTVFMNMASFNLIPTNIVTNKIFDEPVSDKFSDNFSALGYQSLSAIQNMGLLLFFAAFYLLLQTLWLPIACLIPKAYSSKRWVIWMSENTYGQNFIRFLMESSLEVSVSFLLYIRNSPVLSTSVTLTTSTFFGIIAIFPIVHSAFLIINRHKLQSQEFLAEKKTYYQFLALKHDKPSLVFSMVFTYRRIFLALICTQTQSLTIQLLSVMVIQYFVAFYIGFAQPFMDPEKNNAEMRSELVITFFMILLRCMTNFVVSTETRYQIGYAFTVCFCFYLILSILSIFISQTTRTIQQFKKWRAKRRQKLRVRGGKTRPKLNIDQLQFTVKQTNNVFDAQKVNRTQVLFEQRLESSEAKLVVKNSKPNDDPLNRLIDSILEEQKQSDALEDSMDIVHHKPNLVEASKLISQRSQQEASEGTIMEQQSLQKTIKAKRRPILPSEIDGRSQPIAQVIEPVQSVTSSKQGWRQNFFVEAGEEIMSQNSNNSYYDIQLTDPVTSTFAPVKNRPQNPETQIFSFRAKHQLNTMEVVDLEQNVFFIQLTSSFEPPVSKLSRVLVNGYEVGGPLRC